MKIRRIVILTIILSACGAGDKASNLEYETFVNNERYYQIDYPKEWDTNRLNLSMDFNALEPLQDSADFYTEGLNISVYPNTDNISLVEIVDENIKMAKRMFPQTNAEKTSFITDSGIEGEQVSLTFDTGRLNLSNTATFIAGHGNLYTITYSSETQYAKAYKPIFEKMLNSFTWTIRE